MKKLLFGLIAAVMISFTGNAQSSPEAKSFADAQMITVVHAMKPNFVRGMKLPDFIKTTGPTNPTPADLRLLEKTYSYLNAGTSDCDIIKGDNSVIIDVIKAPISDSPAEARKFCWKCLLQAIVAVAEVVMEVIDIFTP